MDKGHILNEIKRIATASGGTPLGIQRFLKETGIERHDWCGVYWARWGDAVRETGFEPNQFEETDLPEELLELSAQLAVELGHLPTSAEIRLKASETRRRGRRGRRPTSPQARHRVTDRPDRYEPRQPKRRPKTYDRLMKPRHETKRAMLKDVQEK